MQQPGSATGKGASWRIEQFDYPSGPNAVSLPGWDGLTTDSASAAEEATRNRACSGNETGMRAEFEKQLAEETRKSFEAGRERGRQEGRQTEHEAQAAALAAAEEQRVSCKRSSWRGISPRSATGT